MAAYASDRPALSLYLDGFGSGLFTGTTLVFLLFLLRRWLPTLLPPRFRSCPLSARRSEKRVVWSMATGPAQYNVSQLSSGVGHVRVVHAPHGTRLGFDAVQSVAGASEVAKREPPDTATGSGAASANRLPRARAAELHRIT